MTRPDDARLLDRFDRRLAAIEAEVPSPSRWRAHTPTHSLDRTLQSMFSATKFVVAGAIVALLGGTLLVIRSAELPIGPPGAATGEAGTFSPAGSLAEPRGGHTATLLPDGRVLVVGGDIHGRDPGSFTTTAEIWDPVTATLAPTGSLAAARESHTATLLPDSRVLVVGGGRGDDEAASAEVWDPATGAFGPAGSLAEPRADHTATLLPDGRVLIVGGCIRNGCRNAASAEVWDPEANAFSQTGSLAEPRSSHTATLLPDGRVLIAGGEDPTSLMTWHSEGQLLSRTIVDSAEVWDPATEMFSPAGTHASRFLNTTTVLPDGRVFVAGHDPVTNEDGDRETFATTEVWDPATSTFSPAGSPAMGWIFTAVVLPDGRILVEGLVPYVNESTGDEPYVAKFWDPATNAFSPAGSLARSRSFGQTTTHLPDGRVLVIGGCIGDYCEGGTVASAEIWDPVAATFIPAGSLAEPRADHTATLLPDGRVLIVGGGGEEGLVESVEVWAPSGA